MNWIYRLERKLGRNFGVSNIMLYITTTMLAFYVLSLIIMPGLFGLIAFDRELILSGEFWRIITFLLVPPYLGSPLWVLVSLFMVYRFGTSVEQTWGKTRLTLYLLFGALGAIAAGFISGFAVNTFVASSIVLVFCYLHPHASLLLFFVLPVKARYIAIFTWAGFIVTFILLRSLAFRMAIVFAVLNFLLFFGPDVWRTMRQNYNIVRRRKQYQKNWGDNNPWR